jgi:hypothetical protein
MKKLIMLVLLPLLLASCEGQVAKSSGQADSTKYMQSETRMPKADIRVNKAYDDKGNLISYDSTYVWSYSNHTGDSVNIDVDSVMQEFWPFMNSRMQDGTPYLEDQWWGYDSLFYDAFLNHDYFMSRWKENRKAMDRMIREMDSVKGLFFREHYPQLDDRETNSR